jgi:hypothetical protein
LLPIASIMLARAIFFKKSLRFVFICLSFSFGVRYIFL